MSMHDDKTVVSSSDNSIPSSPCPGEKGMFEDLTMTEITNIIAIPGNDKCVDCGASRPDWASLGFGVLICLECAGYHRSLGKYISLIIYRFVLMKLTNFIIYILF